LSLSILFMLMGFGLAHYLKRQDVALKTVDERGL